MSYPDIKLENHPAKGGGCIASIALNTAAEGGAIPLGLEPLSKSGGRFENWYAPPARRLRPHESGVRYAANEHMAFGFLSMHRRQPVAETTARFYRALFAILKECGDFTPLRVWHYLPDLSGTSEPTPYQRFCRARTAVIRSVKPKTLCAATVIGSGTQQGMFYFLAAARPGHVINNPRQTNPSDYPLQCAAPPPLFARAVLHHSTDAIRLYISGTASIVGHRSQHANDALAQLDEMANNLEALIAATAEAEPAFAGKTLQDLRCARLYLKHSADYDDITRALHARFGQLPELSVFRGEICRPELLVEMEAMLEQHPRVA